MSVPRMKTATKPLIEPKCYRRILCPVDLSQELDQGLNYAVRLASIYGAELFILHCQEALPTYFLEFTKEYLENSILQHADLAGLSAVDWHGLVTVGNPIDAIPAEATALKADLIVINSKRAAVAAEIVGSTAQAVCHTAPCPVLVIRTDYHSSAAPDSTGRFKRILVAYDFSHYSELALAHALSLAKEFHADLHILHALKDYETAESLPDLARVEMLTERLIEMGTSRDWKGSLICKVTIGSAYEKILDYAANNSIDLICLGAHGEDFGRWSLFGSNADRVMLQSHCPILIVRSEATAQEHPAL